jgi:purine-cytosine permease-like protein
VLFIPWSAVNLTDYFVVRRARYDVGAFFLPGATSSQNNEDRERERGCDATTSG